MARDLNVMEKYRIEDEGYHPFLIREGWQVAQLNYNENQKVENISRIDIHHYTDEVFMLMKGKAVLIGAEIVKDEPVFNLEIMLPGTVYNIPVNSWHNIAMQPGCEVLIIEKDNTHVSDFEFFKLSDKKRVELIEKVNKLIKVEE